MGGVYIIKHESREFYKIGKANDYAARMKTFGVTLPFSIKPVLWLESETPFALEGYLKARFASKRVQGEWFTLSLDDILSLEREFGQTLNEAYNVIQRTPGAEFEQALEAFKLGGDRWQDAFNACWSLASCTVRLINAGRALKETAIVDQALSAYFAAALADWRQE